MKYLVIELQTAADGSVANLVTAHDTRNAAESKYHHVLAAAAVSNLPVHAAVLIASDGGFIAAQSYGAEGGE